MNVIHQKDCALVDYHKGALVNTPILYNEDASSAARILHADRLSTIFCKNCFEFNLEYKNSEQEEYAIISKAQAHIMKVYREALELQFREKMVLATLLYRLFETGKSKLEALNNEWNSLSRIIALDQVDVRHFTGDVFPEMADETADHRLFKSFRSLNVEVKSVLDFVVNLPTKARLSHEIGCAQTPFWKLESSMEAGQNIYSCHYGYFWKTDESVSPQFYERYKDASASLIKHCIK
nr:hypothetical protein BdHM001_36050 [Bdellovibrio sp. HM001]